MIKKVLQINYVFADWLAKKKDRLIPLTGHLFLTKLSYLWITVFSIIAPLIFDKKLDAKLIVGTAMLGTLIINYGLQGKIKQMIKEKGFKKEVKQLSKSTVYRYRALGLFYQIFFFTLMFVVAVLSFR